MSKIVTEGRLNEMTGMSIDCGKGGGYCPHYQTIVSLWGSVVASSNYQPNQLVKEEDIQLSTFQYDFNIHVSITNSGLTSKSYDFVADVYIDGVPDGFITIPRSGTLDYQGATFFDRNFHFDLPTDLTNVPKLLFTGYFSTYRVTVDADSVTNNAVCQSGVTTEIPINQAYIGGDTANISINVII